MLFSQGNSRWRCLISILGLHRGKAKGVPQAMKALGMKDFLGDVGCKLLFYLHRVVQGSSICITSLLSGFKSITVSSSAPRWTEFKMRASDRIVSSCYTCWLLSLLLQIVTPLRVSGRNHDRNNTMIRDFAYCTGIFQHTISILLYALLLASVDFLLLGIMVWASGSMVWILYRHKQRVQYIQNKHISHKTFPETRATHTILVLVSIFVAFYSLSSILAFYMAFFDSQNVWLYNISTLEISLFALLHSSWFTLQSANIKLAKRTIFSELIHMAETFGENKPHHHFTGLCPTLTLEQVLLQSPCI
ncbi:vomeronasal type-1 receptor 4-like [Trichechus manatus latirostris]|uniref:Vomeronasal type-1 receptor n=1 Tax=Trichechus manatus latirostris TaxID=127582 RepID=A0A2Y9RZ20_TRIMA|nr:vomeronasal type-1 receptor 4-like [Trichechus manatus latirostris]